MFELGNEGQDHTEYNIRHHIRWQISFSIKVIFEYFSLALTIFQIFTFKIRELENVGQNHDIQHSQLQIHDFLCHGNSNVCIFQQKYVKITT